MAQVERLLSEAVSVLASPGRLMLPDREHAGIGVGEEDASLLGAGVEAVREPSRLRVRGLCDPGVPFPTVCIDEFPRAASSLPRPVAGGPS